MLLTNSMGETQVCKSCQTTYPNTYFFCPICGKKLKDAPLSTSFSKQAVLYLISFFLPPFGLPQGIRYLKQNGGKTKAIGITIVLLTIASISITIMVFTYFMSSVSKLYNGDLNSYQGIGF